MSSEEADSASPSLTAVLRCPHDRPLQGAAIAPAFLSKLNLNKLEDLITVGGEIDILSVLLVL